MLTAEVHLRLAVYNQSIYSDELRNDTSGAFTASQSNMTIYCQTVRDTERCVLMRGIMSGGIDVNTSTAYRRYSSKREWCCQMLRLAKQLTTAEWIAGVQELRYICHNQ